ncbi:MAG: TatD family hydrolase [Kiritimatiellae bacterium]|nr:TatD family hydrolase [Kiritimatiellia bacterium]
MFDSHCHFEPGVDAAGWIARARAAGLDGLLACGGSPEADEGARLAAGLAPGFALAAFGLDRDAADAVAGPADMAARMAALERTLLAERAAAVGEIGLDYSRGEDAAARARQRALFAAQLRLAAKLGLPCSIHSRGAEEDTVALLRENLSPELAAAGRAGSLHCFVGTAEFAAALAPLGLCFGLSGIVTFRNADALRAVVPLLPRDRILVETDSPWLAPVPLRGRPCEPAFAVHTARRVAELLGLPEREAFALFSANARRVFAAR